MRTGTDSDQSPRPDPVRRWPPGPHRRDRPWPAGRRWRDRPWPAGQRWRDRGRQPPALLVPAVIAVIQLVGSNGAEHSQPDARPLDLFGQLLLIIGPLALVLRSRHRAAGFVLTLATTTTYFLLDYPRGPGFLALLIALVGAVRHGYRVLVWSLAGVAYLAFVVVAVWTPSWRPGGWPLATPSTAEVLIVGAWLLVVLAFAERARVGAERFAQAARARAEAARAREEQERRQASDERLRIARELHDVLGHHLSLINVQAGVGLHLMDQRPEQARAALVAIKQASAEALGEVRSVLSALRPENESAPRAPAPGIADIDTLVADMRAAGVPVRFTVEGPPRPVPAEVDRAAYRIVQESLTNVRRHAGAGASADVTVGYAPDQLRLRIADDGAVAGHGASDVAGAVVGRPDGTDESGTVPAPAPDSGTGIPGMRARATGLGGGLTAGPRTGGGFEVSGWFPLPEVDR